MLIEPQAKYTDIPKVLGLDGEHKMSKSRDNYIEIAASPEEIERRVMSMVTDPQRRRLSDPGRPEVCNVFTLHGVFSPDDVDQIEVDCRNANIGCVQCKKLFAKNLADYFAPFRARRAELASDPERVWQILREGAQQASAVASDVMAEVRAAIQLP